MKKNILILEDLVPMYTLYKYSLGDKFNIAHCINGAQFKAFENKQSIHLILMDYTLHGTEEKFEELLQYAKNYYPNAKRILVSANVESMDLHTAHGSDFDDIVSKTDIDFVQFHTYIHEKLHAHH